ncbi:MAG: hypothetical protein V9E94_10680 [Microthrixaceae bacterium]
MNNLTLLPELPTLRIGEQTYLSERAVMDIAAATFFPDRSLNTLNEADYQQLRQMAEAHCRSLGYTRLLKLAPPVVSFAEMGFYWVKEVATRPNEQTPEPENDDEAVATQADEEEAESEPFLIMAGPGLVEELAEGRLHDARLGPLGLDEVTGQHYTIPVLADEAVIDLMGKAVNSTWPNDYKGIWHDIMSQSKRGRDISRTERTFTVIIRGVGQKQYWPMSLHLKHDPAGDPYLFVTLIDAPQTKRLFALGHVVMTDGAAALGVDFRPYIARHRTADWGEQLDDFDKRQNNRAVKEGLRILSAYNVPVGGGESERIWIITEADRSVTIILLPQEY